MTTLQEILFLVEQQNSNALELAWALNEYYPSWLEEVGYPAEAGATREARKDYLVFLHQQINGVPYNTLRDRFSVGRAWTRQRYASLTTYLGWRPTYHQVRALSTDEIEIANRLRILVNWMRTNERIPSVEEMHEMFGGNKKDRQTSALLALKRTCRRVLALEAGTRNLRAAVQNLMEFLNAEVPHE